MYLNSILISHSESGFCIVEFDLFKSKKPSNLQVIKSSGIRFAELASKIITDIEFGLDELSEIPSGRFRLPMYFKNSKQDNLPLHNKVEYPFKAAI